jgi:hypothetical protein
MQSTLDALGASLDVVDVDVPSASARLRLSGPASLRFGIEDMLLSRGVFQAVHFE